MEFACQYVYVPPLIEKPKISALLPPVIRVRPRTPPPPPPGPIKDLCSPPSPSSSTLQVDSPRTRAHSAPPSPRIRTPPTPTPLQDNCRAPLLKAPPLPPRPPFLTRFPEYTIIFPSTPPPLSPLPSAVSPLSPISESIPKTSPYTSPSSGSTEKQPLPGNPNVILVDLDKIVTDTNDRLMEGEPTSCSTCGSVLDTCYDNVVASCYFCQSWDPSTPPPIPQPCPPSAAQDSLFLLTPDQRAQAPETLIVFCIDISGSMSISFRVQETDRPIYKTRLEFVQEAVLQCVQTLSQKEPNTRVALVTFNNEVILHGHGTTTSWKICGQELIDGEFLKNAGLTFPTPPPVSETRVSFQENIAGLQEGGATALGPAAVVAIAMASRLPGSKVLICTDGRANTDLGDLESEDKDSCTLVSSTIFYKDLGEYAASEGVTVSVMSLEETDCKLDELGILADSTGGEVVITSPYKLYSAFQEVIESRTKATHCTVTLMLPTTLCVKGEREAGHCTVRKVGNVMPHTELTLQYGPGDQREHSQGLLSTGSVCIQLQVHYRRRDGLSMLRVITVNKEVTSNSSLALSSVCLSVLQLNSIQSSAALAVRGRLRDAQKEKEIQTQLIQQVVEFQQNSGYELLSTEWMKVDPLYNIYNYTRALTDEGAALLFGLKNGNRMSISQRSLSDD